MPLQVQKFFLFATFYVLLWCIVGIGLLPVSKTLLGLFTELFTFYEDLRESTICLDSFMRLRKSLDDLLAILLELAGGLLKLH